MKNPTDVILSSVEQGKGWNFYTNQWNNLILLSKIAGNSPWSGVSAVRFLLGSTCIQQKTPLSQDSSIKSHPLPLASFSSHLGWGQDWEVSPGMLGMWRLHLQRDILETARPCWQTGLCPSPSSHSAAGKSQGSFVEGSSINNLNLRAGSSHQAKNDPNYPNYPCQHRAGMLQGTAGTSWSTLNILGHPWIPASHFDRGVEELC